MGSLRVLLFASALAAAGCPSLPPLPPEPGSPARPAPPVTLVSREEGATPGDLLTPSRSGDRIHSGVFLLDPSLDPATGTATFRVRNDRAEDLPDLILAVVFAMPAPVGSVSSTSSPSPTVPRFETVEAPLASGQEREYRVTLPLGGQDPRPSGFRVVAGLPEILAAPEDGSPGSTFLGGLLECAELEVDLTGPGRHVVVGLRDRPAVAGGTPVPPVEGQLLLARAGVLVWTGPWIRLPTADPDGGKVRRVRWNLPAEPGLAACTIYLRIREKR